MLVASEALDGALFARSVVLLTEHSAGWGGRGVMLTQPMGQAPAAPALSPEGGGGGGGEGEEAAAWATAAAAAAAGGGGGGEGAGDEASGEGSRRRRSWRASSGGSNGSAPQRRPALIKHFMGGPVGLPGAWGRAGAGAGSSSSSSSSSCRRREGVVGFQAPGSEYNSQELKLTAVCAGWLGAGEGVRQEIRVIHTVPGVEGALPILQPPNGTAAAAAAGGAGGPSRPANNHTRLWLGGSLKGEWAWPD